MKAKYTLLMLALGIAATVAAQETDDMYFNAKDRLAQNESNSAVMASRYAAHDVQAVASNPVNPSDSYTGRGVNPEFSAQQKNGATIVQEDPDYFLATYKPKGINSGLNTTNSNSYTGCGCGYRSPYSAGYGGGMYSPYGYASPYGSMYSPYGSMYSPYGNMYSPYGSMYSPYGSGLTTSMGYGFGSYGSAWSLGLSYGMGSMYGSPGYNSYYGNPYSYATAVNPDMPHVVYGRRPIRSGSSNNSSAYTGSPATAGTNGRVRETGQTRTNYYNQGWRRDPNNFSSRTYDYNGRPVISNGSNGRSWSGDPGRTRSYNNNSTGVGSRSMGSSFGGASRGGSVGGGGGHSRGRN